MQLCIIRPIILYNAHRQDGCCDRTTMLYVYNNGRKERKKLCTMPLIPLSNI